MAKIIGVSGAQGAGKSTMLKALADRGWYVDDFKVSRDVQARLGWSSLDVVMTSVDAMKHFQLSILDAKREHDLMLSQRCDAIILTERTFADISAYTGEWCVKHSQLRNWGMFDACEWLADFSRQCAEAQRMCYSGVLLLPFMSHVQWVDDPHRASRTNVDTIYTRIEEFVTREHGKRHVITSASVDDRVVEAETFLRTL